MSEPLTTPAAVRAIASNLAHRSDEDLTIFIGDAQMDVLEYKLTDSAKNERLTRWLAAHLATLDSRRTVTEKAADLQLTFKADGSTGKELDSTAYGQEYKRLLKRFGILSTLNLVVGHGSFRR